MFELGDELGIAKKLAYTISPGDITTSIKLRNNDTSSLIAYTS
jgi:hypothetical protein